jgi:hypothetical protein
MARLGQTRNKFVDVARELLRGDERFVRASGGRKGGLQECRADDGK